MTRKSEDFSGRLKAYESRQHPEAISLGYLLVVHSKKEGLPFKKAKENATIIQKNVDATVKVDGHRFHLRQLRYFSNYEEIK